MKNKKLTALLLSLALAAAMLTGCGSSGSAPQQSAQSAAQESAVSGSAESLSVSGAEDQAAAAEQLLNDLTGTYEQLWPVLLDARYHDIWLKDCAAIVGNENAQATADKLISMVTADIYGEDAVKAYKDNPDGAAYNCSFTQGLYHLTFDGTTISGVDVNGNVLFSHTYHFIGMEESRGFYEFESDDPDAGEFTYFFLAPDTPNTTFHIEFRYGADKEALASLDSGAYAYWMASGIPTNHDQKMIENCIELFCRENLAEQ